MKRLCVLGIAMLIGVLGGEGAAFADTAEKSIPAPDGRIEIRDKDLFDSELTLDGRVLKTDTGRAIKGGSLHIEAVLPSSDDPAFAILTLNTGGNLCSVWGIHVLRLKGGLWLSDDLGACGVESIWPRLESGVLFVEVASFDETNEFGDPAVLTWKHDGKKLRVLPADGVPDFWKHEGMHPHAFLGVRAIRGPLAAVLGTDFKDVRERLSVASEMTVVRYRYLVGSGCLPHSCGSDEAVLVVDAYRGDAWAFYVKDGARVRTLGPARRNVRLPRIPELGEWLDRWGLEIESAEAPVQVRQRQAESIQKAQSESAPPAAPVAQAPTMPRSCGDAHVRAKAWAGIADVLLEVGMSPAAMEANYAKLLKRLDEDSSPDAGYSKAALARKFRIDAMFFRVCAAEIFSGSRLMVFVIHNPKNTGEWGTLAMNIGVGRRAAAYDLDFIK